MQRQCSWAINWEIQKLVIGQSNNFSLKSKSSQEQLNVILQGLPPESDVLVTFISRKFELLQIEYLLAQESWIENQKRDTETEMPSVNITQKSGWGPNNKDFRGCGGRNCSSRGWRGRSQFCPLPSVLQNFATYHQSGIIEGKKKTKTRYGIGTRLVGHCLPALQILESFMLLFIK